MNLSNIFCTTFLNLNTLELNKASKLISGFKNRVYLANYLRTICNAYTTNELKNLDPVETVLTTIINLASVELLCFYGTQEPYQLCYVVEGKGVNSKITLYSISIKPEVLNYIKKVLNNSKDKTTPSYECLQYVYDCVNKWSL